MLAHHGHTGQVLFVLLFGQLVTAFTISIQTTVPSNATALSPSLLSFSIEQDRWTDWVGTTSRNNFFFNTLDNLKQLTGEPPQIRIGANSEDHTNCDDSVQFSEGDFPAPSTTVPYPEAKSIRVSDRYYATAQYLPPHTHVVWGLNFGQRNGSAAICAARAILDAFSSPAFVNANITLDALEIGNEPDLYMNNGLRPSSYGSPQYVEEWLSFARNMTVQLGMHSSSAKFWGAAFAGSSHTTSGFSPQAVFDEGLLSYNPGEQISTFSQHRYSGSFCSGSGGLLQDLMTKSTIRSNLSTFNSDIAAVRAKGLDYVLGETNSYSCHGAPGVSNTAGAALWTLDYLLYASQIGISRVFFHQGIGFKYSLIQPATLYRSTLDGSTLSRPLPPHIQAQYYAAIIAAEAIGNSGGTRAVEISINLPRLAGYAFYGNDGNLRKVLLINSQAWFTSSTGKRGETHVDLSFIGSSTPKSMTVKRLFVSHADDTAGLTWGGQTYETSDGRVAGTLNTTSVPTASGVDIKDTEVVMLAFVQ